MNARIPFPYRFRLSRSVVIAGRPTDSVMIREPTLTDAIDAIKKPNAAERLRRLAMLTCGLTLADFDQLPASDAEHLMRLLRPTFDDVRRLARLSRSGVAA